MSRDLCLALLGVASLLGAGSARAQPVDGELRVDSSASEDDEARARTFFEAGQLAYVEARFQTALENFQSAYDLSQRPELLFNVGLAQERGRCQPL